MTELPEKSKQRNAPPELLLWDHQFELDTEFSFDECIDRFQGIKSELESVIAPSVKINISSADADAVYFNMHIGHGLVRAWLIAHLDHLDDGSTIVRGVAGVDPSIILLFGFILVFPIGGVIFVQSLIAFLMGAFLAATIIIFLYFSSKSLKNDLLNKL